MAVPTRQEIAELLQLHTQAYKLLLWLGREAVQNPSTLAPEVVELLARPATCDTWLESNRSNLPSDLMPQLQNHLEFVNLFSSFFSTSFRVDHFSIGGELLDSSLSTGSERAGKPSGYVEAQALALRHLGG